MSDRQGSVRTGSLVGDPAARRDAARGESTPASATQAIPVTAAQSAQSNGGSGTGSTASKGQPSDKLAPAAGTAAGTAPASAKGPASGTAPASGKGPASGTAPVSGAAPASAKGPASGTAPASAKGPASGTAPVSGAAPGSGKGPASGTAPASGAAPGSGTRPPSGKGPASGTAPAAGSAAAGASTAAASSTATATSGTPEASSSSAARAKGRGPAKAGGRGPRRARLQLRHIDTWSALKISLVLSIALFFIWMVAVGVLYLVLSGLGVFDTLNDLFGQLGSASGSKSGGSVVVTPGVVFGGAAVIGAINIVLLTALCTVGTFIYNLCSDLVGGLEVTLSERD